MQNKFSNKLKINLCRIPFANKLITERSLKIAKKNIDEIEIYLRKKNINMVGPQNFNYISSKNYSHCNIWGSGLSSAISKHNKKLKNNAFNIGIGFSYLLNIDFNFYFIENAQKSQSELVNRQKKGIERFIDLKNCPILFKNIWEAKNDVNFAVESYKNIALFARDFNISHYLNKKFIYENSLKILLNHDQKYFKQSCSSVITAIIFARYLGFKKIVLHGIDFYGGYFFDNPDYESLKEFTPPYFDDQQEIYNKKWRDQKKNHPTNNCLKSFLPLLRDSLKNEEIDLLSSIKESRSASILDIY